MFMCQCTWSVHHKTYCPSQQYQPVILTGYHANRGEGRRESGVGGKERVGGEGGEGGKGGRMGREDGVGR